MMDDIPNVGTTSRHGAWACLVYECPVIQLLPLDFCQALQAISFQIFTPMLD
jgi:hypothetical protein